MKIALVVYRHLLMSLMIKRSHVICTFGRCLRRPSTNARSCDEGCLSRQGCTTWHNTGSACVLFFVCLSSIFSPVSFLDMVKPKCFHASDLKLTSAVSQSCHWFATCAFCHLCRTKDNEHAWPDGKCSPHFPLFCFNEAERNYAFCLEILLFETFINNIKALLSPW